MQESKIISDKPVVSFGLSMLTESYDADDDIGEPSDQSRTHTPTHGRKILREQKLLSNKQTLVSEKVQEKEKSEIFTNTPSPIVERTTENKMIEIDKEAKLNEEKEDSKTPNTDEYRSNWESDDDIIGILQPDKSFSSHSWENDDKLDLLSDRHKIEKKNREKKYENEIYNDKKESKYHKSKTDRKKSEEKYDKKDKKQDRDYKYDKELEDKYKRKESEDRKRKDDKHKPERKKSSEEIRKVYEKELIELDIAPKKYERRRESVESSKKYDKEIEINFSPRRIERRRTESGDKFNKKEEKRDKYKHEETEKNKREELDRKKHDEEHRKERKKEERIVYEESDEFKDARKREDAEMKERKSRYEEHEERTKKYDNYKKKWEKHEDKQDKRKKSEDRIRDKMDEAKQLLKAEEKELQRRMEIELDIKIKNKSSEDYRKSKTINEENKNMFEEVVIKIHENEDYTPELKENIKEIDNSKDILQNLNKILKPEINNSWSTDEEEDNSIHKNDKKKKEIDKKDYKKLCRELKEQLKEKLSKKHKKKNKESKKEKKNHYKEKQKKTKSKDKYKNVVHIDYNDYEKHLEESIFWENKKVVEDIKPRNIIKIDYSDFDRPFEKRMIKEIIPKEEIISLKDFGLPQEKNKEEKVEIIEKIEFPKEEIKQPKQEVKQIEDVSNQSEIVMPIAVPTPVLPVTPVTPVQHPQNKSFLVSEYEEFMKAVCFDTTITDTSYLDTTDDTNITLTNISELNNELLRTEDSVILTKKPEIDSKSVQEIEKSVIEEEKSESSSESSTEQSDESDSDTDSTISSKHSQPVLITKIKQEKLSESENEEPTKKKKPELNTPEIVVKKEKIDEEKVIKNYEKNQNFVNLDDIIMPAVLPENIPLPQEPSSTSEKLETIDSSPKLTTEPQSPIKKQRSLIPIKLLTAETRKQANETTNIDETPFGVIPIKTIDDKTVSSSDLQQTTSQKIATMYEGLPTIELLPNRKRQASINLNISPVKKLHLEPPKDGEESDEDFTERFIKDKKVEPIKDEKEKLEQKHEEVKKEKPKPERLPEKEDKVKNQEPERKSRRNSKEKRLSEEKRHDRSRERRRRTPERRRDPKRDYSRDRETRRGRRSRKRDRRSPRRRSREKDEKYRRKERRYSRSPSPKRERFRSPSPRHQENIEHFNANIEFLHSPVNSPLDGFKRSLADSTISDSELSKRNFRDESVENSPRYNIPSISSRVDSPASPKRISLDDRINQVLGIEKEPPKAIDTVCTRGQYDTGHQPAYHEYQYHREYEGYMYTDQYQYGYPQQYPQTRNEGNIKVVQVGNVIQVVPTEQPIQSPVIQQPPLPKVSLIIIIFVYP